MKVEDDQGRVSYEPVDTKLARRAKPAAVLQLTFYSHELARNQGRLPERMRVVLGTGLEEEFGPESSRPSINEPACGLSRRSQNGPRRTPTPSITAGSAPSSRPVRA